MQIEVLMTGIGGQGVQLAAKTLAVAATDEGRQAMLSAHYGGEMRGGQTEATVVVGDGPLRALPIIPSSWSAYVMHPKFWDEVRVRLRPGAVVVANGDLLEGLEVPDGQVVAVPVNRMAVELEAPLSAGFILLGAYAAVTGLVGLESLVAAMRQLVPPYRTQHLAANEAALRAGHDAYPEVVVPAWAQAVSASTVSASTVSS